MRARMSGHLTHTCRRYICCSVGTDKHCRWQFSTILQYKISHRNLLPSSSKAHPKVIQSKFRGFPAISLLFRSERGLSLTTKSRLINPYFKGGGGPFLPASLNVRCWTSSQGVNFEPLPRTNCGHGSGLSMNNWMCKKINGFSHSKVDISWEPRRKYAVGNKVKNTENK